MAVAIFRQRTATQTDHRNAPRGRPEQQETHHRARVPQGKGVRIVQQHGALNPARIKVQRNNLLVLYDQRLVQVSLLSGPAAKMRTSVPCFARNDMTDMTSLALTDRPFAMQTISLANR